MSRIETKIENRGYANENVARAAVNKSRLHGKVKKRLLARIDEQYADKIGTWAPGAPKGITVEGVKSFANGHATTVDQLAFRICLMAEGKGISVAQAIELIQDRIKELGVS